MLLGTMLGDGYMDASRKNPRYRGQHGFKQHEYNCRKYQVLSEFVQTPPKKVRNSGFGEWSSYWMTRQSEALRPIASLCLRDGKKFVTREWLDLLTWEGVAWWFMDDGTKSGSRFILCTHGFSELEVVVIRDWFLSRNLDANLNLIAKRGKSGTYPIIRFTNAASRQLADLIRPYVFPEMAYKISLPTYTSEVTCYWCKTIFTSKVGRNPDSTKRPFCGSAACWTARSRENYLKVKADPEKLKARRATASVNSRKYHERHPGARAAIDKKRYAKAAEARKLLPWKCQECGLEEPRGDRSGHVRYCTPCRDVVTRRTKQKSALRHPRSST
jgi:hypothetical protein